MREAISKWSPVDPDELASSASSTSSDDDAEDPAADDSDDAHPMSSSCSSNLIVASLPRANTTQASIPTTQADQIRRTSKH